MSYHDQCGQACIDSIARLPVQRQAAILSIAAGKAVYFYYPAREIDEIHMTLPSGVQVENLPANDVQKLEYAGYKTEQKPEGTNGIFALRDLVMAGMAFPPNMYPR